MKKIATIFLSVFVLLALALSFSSCNRSAYVNQALSKAKGWDAVDFDVKTNVQATVLGQTENLSSEYSVKIKYLQSYDPLVMAKTNVTLYGETVPADVFYDGTYYVITNNDAVKLRSATLIEGGAFVADWKNMLTALPNSAVKAAEEKDNGDGTKTAAVSVDVTTFETIYRNVLDEWEKKLVKQYADGSAVSDLRVSEPKISVTVHSNNGTLKSYTGECNLELLAETQTGELVTVTMTFSQTLSCNGYGTDVAFAFPEDYEEYMLSDGINLDSEGMLSNAVGKALKRSEMDISLRLALGAENISVKNVQANGIGTENWSFVWNETSLRNDKWVNSEVYYTNGWYYTNVYGELQHLKYERSEETDEFYGYESDFQYLLKNLTNDDYKSATVVSNEDGTRTFTIPFASSRFQKAYEELVTEAKSIAKINGAVSVSEGFVELILDKKGALKSCTASFSLTEKSAENPIPYDFAYGLTFNDAGKTVTVTPLDGYELFVIALERKQEFFGDVEKAIEDVLGADALNAYIFYSQYVDAEVIKINKQQESITAAVDMKTNPNHFSKFTITDDGETYNEEVYCEDGYLYIKSDIDDSMKMTVEDASEKDIFWMIYMIKMLPEKYFDRVFFETEDGNTTLSIEMTMEELEEIFPEVVESLGIGFILPSIKDQKIEESRFAITVNENNELVSYEVKLTADFVVGNTNPLDCEAALEIYYEFNTERSAIEITPPDGYQDFEEW